MSLNILHENSIIGEMNVVTDQLSWTGFPRPPVAQDSSPMDLLIWLSQRVSPYAVSDQFGIPYYGIAFTDNFWICQKKETLFFEDVHAFSNASIPSNPNCLVLNEHLALVKPYTPNEYYAFHAAQLLGLNTVQYYPLGEHLVSPIQTSLNESWFNVHDMRCYDKVLRSYPIEIANMIMFDGIVGNSGRSSSNISLICEPYSQRVKMLAPTYSLHATFHFVEDVDSVWGKDLIEAVRQHRNKATLKPSNLAKQLYRFPDTLRETLYHNLLCLGLI